MRTLPPGMQAHLDTGTTTLCHCWRLTLASGEKLGFTDHDENLIFDGTTFEKAAGFTASELESSLGLSIDNMEAAGALSSAQLSEERLRAGDFDHAVVEVWRVNWADVSQRLLMRKGHLGEVTTGAGAFQAEVRGLAHIMNQTKGRLYQFGCDAALGDQRCGVDLSAPAFRQSGTVIAVEESAIRVTGITFADDWATRGVLKFTSGAGSGRELAVKRQRTLGTSLRIEFWQKPSFAIALGDSVTLTTGCDKRFATCRDKFSNALNYRGFPHMPGADFVMAFASENDANNDGGKRD